MALCCPSCGSNINETEAEVVFEMVDVVFCDHCRCLSEYLDDGLLVTCDQKRALEERAALIPDGEPQQG